MFDPYSSFNQTRPPKIKENKKNKYQKIILSNIISGIMCASLSYITINTEKQKDELFKNNLINIGKIIVSTIIILILSLKFNLYVSKFISEILMIVLMHEIKNRQNKKENI